MENFPENIKNAIADFSFKKAERLCSKKLIDKLFSEGHALKCYPLKVVYLPVEYNFQFPAQAGFSVGKKLFKRAVKRNLLKRRMRESYRLNKPIFYNSLQNISILVFFVYIGKDISDFATIENATKRALKRIVNNVTNDK